MSDAPILDLAGVGKSYRGYGSLWWRAAGWITGHPSHFTDHWVLREVSFALRRGEAVGVVGRNGAGKSTLLKIIAGTLTPTEGRVAVHGKVSAILELGMGFNREFTGRENVVHSCGLLGYEPARVHELLPWIESFADVGEYFDQPMRTYSSGMSMRVAFAVATAVRPDILIVDEALSVGDAAFQRKSFRRIEEFIADGTSLLLVTHGTDQVRNICDRALWIEQGRLRLDGPAKSVTEAYEKALFAQTAPPAADPTRPAHGFIDSTVLGANIEVEYGDGLARIVGVELSNGLGEPVNALPIGEPFTVSYEVRFLAPCREAHFGMLIKTIDGVTVYGTNTDHEGLESSFGAGDVVKVSFALQNNLCPGIYYLNCGASHATPDGRAYLHRRVDVAALRVLPGRREEAIAGLAYLAGRIRIEHLELAQS